MEPKMGMSFTDKIDVLEMFLALHEEHLKKLDILITMLEKAKKEKNL